MRARYYNPDIKRFINQDIKVGDIGSSQSLNRYAYCEGNPVSLIDPFGLSPQGNNIFGEFTIHDMLGVAGLALNFFGAPGVIAAAVCDVADAVIYFGEGDPVAGMISVVCAIPAVGDAVGIFARGGKIANTGRKIANLLIDAGKNSRTVAKVADAAKAAKTLIKTAGGKAGDFAYAAGKMIVKGLRKGASKLDDAANLLRHQGDKLYTSAKNAVKKLKGEKSTRGVLSDYLGVAEHNSNGFFYSIKNKLGGDVFVSVDAINNNHFKDIVNNAKGKVNILSGVHGDREGNILRELEFFVEDWNEYIDNDMVNVLNFADMDYKEIVSVINSLDTTICAWCFSERNPAVRLALLLGELKR